MRKQAAHIKSPKVLLLVDVVTHFRVPDGDNILKNAMPQAARLARLKETARRSDTPSIYVNDNFGQWHSDPAKIALAVSNIVSVLSDRLVLAWHRFHNRTSIFNVQLQNIRYPHTRMSSEIGAELLEPDASGALAEAFRTKLLPVNS